METIVVTGLRSSLNAAEQIKRTNFNVVDAIVPEDVGKLPDRSVGDALQRIPGVQVSRNNNQVTGVNIRGLPNVVTTLNGEEIFTTTGRTYSFQNLPSEVLAGLNVYKTASADQIEGGIAGMIDIKTHRPFDFDGFQLAGGLEATYDNVVGHVNPKGNLLISDRWRTSAGEFGVLLNVTDNYDWFMFPVVWEDTPHNARPTSNTGLAQPIYVPFMGSATTLGHRSYPEANLSLQFRPMDGVEIYADVIYSGWRQRSADVFFFSATADWNGADPLFNKLTNVTLAPDGCVTLKNDSGCMVQTATVGGGVGKGPYTATSTQAHDFKQNDLHAEVGTNIDRGPWHADTKFSITTSAYHDTREIIDVNIPDEITTLNSNVDGHGVWSLSIPATSKDVFYLQNLFESWVINHGVQFTWAGHVKYDVGEETFIRSIEGGLRYSDRKANSQNVQGGGQGYCVPSQTTPGNCASGAYQAASIFTDAGFWQMFRGGEGNPAQFLAPSTNYLLDNVATVRAKYNAPAAGLPMDPANSFRDTEDTEAVWLQAQYHIDLGSIPVDGQLGARYVSTSRRMTGSDVTNIPALTNTTGAPLTLGGITYAPGATIRPASRQMTPFAIPNTTDDFLPSISAIAHLTDELQLHASFGKSLTRPGFAALNPALSTTPPTINREGAGSQGNPNLSPIRSTAYDLSLEYYFDGGGSASIAGFYRNVAGYILPVSNTFAYDTAYCVANGIPTTAGGPCTIRINSSISAGKGYIEGMEVSAQKFFDFLPGAWSGLGVQANYTWIQSRAPIRGQNGDADWEYDLTQVSKNNASLILMYEKYGLSMRLAGTYRSKYVEGFYPGNNTLPPINFVKPTVYLDLGVNYDLTNQLTASFNATNLLGATYNSYSGTPLFPRDIRTVSQMFTLGVHYRLN